MLAYKGEGIRKGKREQQKGTYLANKVVRREGVLVHHLEPDPSVLSNLWTILNL